MSRISRQLQADWPNHMSYDKSNSDVDKFYSYTNGVIMEQESVFYKKRQIDIFLLAMAIGKEQNNRVKVKKPSQTIRCDALHEEEVWLMCSVVLAEEGTDLDVLADPPRLIRICEEYANGGIEYLMQLEKQTDLNNKQYEESLERAIENL